MSRVSVVRESVVRIVKMLTEKKITVTQRGSTAFVSYGEDGSPQVVNIPYIPDTVSEELLMATQGFLDHEVAHVLFTDYASLKAADKWGVKSLHNIIEDAFIERKMTGAFPGSSLNLRNVGEYFLKTYTDKKLAEDSSQANNLLIVPAIRAWSGQSVYIDYMKDKWHLIEEIVNHIGKEAAERLPKIKNSMEAAEAARDFRDLLEHKKEEEAMPPPPPPPVVRRRKDKMEDGREIGGTPPKPKSGDSAPSEIDSESPPETVASVTEDEHEEGGESEESGDDTEPSDSGDDDEVEEEEDDEVEEEEDDEDGDVEGGGGGGGTSGSGAKVSAGADVMKDIEKASDFSEELSKKISDSATLEAKKSPYLIYSKDFDIIEPMHVPETRWNDEYLKNMQDTVDHMIGPLQKDFERAVAAKSASTWSTGHRSGRLHPTALSRLQFGDDRVFRRRHINNGKDVAVSLMIDCSGSMTRSKIEAATFAAYGLSSVLDRMNITNEAIGFTTKKSMGSEAKDAERKIRHKYARTQGLYMPIFKGFDERINPETRKRFAYLPNSGILSENVDGECVQIAAQRLAVRRETRKILIVLSDGEPCCPGDYSALQDHLKKTITDVEKGGVEVLGIGIMDSSVQNFYPKYVVLNSLADLPTTVISEIKKILMQ